jgi:hypothetical protein
MNELTRSCGEKLAVCTVCGQWSSWWVLAPFDMEYTGGTPYCFPAVWDRPGPHAKAGQVITKGSAVCSNHVIAAWDDRFTRNLRRIRTVPSSI